MAGEVVLGYDGSDPSQAALAEAIALAQAFDTRVVVAFGAGVNPAGVEGAAHARAVEALGHRVTRDALAALADAGVDAEVAVVGERPVAALLALARSYSARLIVVGTHGAGAASGSMLGSVTYGLVHRSPTPVVVVPVRRPPPGP